MLEAPDIPGAADVIAWFGYWPHFHDAEVLSITLDRSGESQVAITLGRALRNSMPVAVYWRNTLWSHFTWRAFRETRMELPKLASSF